MRHWADIFGKYLSATELLTVWEIETATTGEPLHGWLERQSIELWAATGEYVDEDWRALARQLRSESATEGGHAAD